MPGQYMPPSPANTYPYNGPNNFLQPAGLSRFVPTPTVRPSFPGSTGPRVPHADDIMRENTARMTVGLAKPKTAEEQRREMEEIKKDIDNARTPEQRARAARRQFLAEAHKHHVQALSVLTGMLDGKIGLSTKDAVYAVEKAFPAPKLDYPAYCKQIAWLTDLARQRTPKGAGLLARHQALLALFRDSTFTTGADGAVRLVKKPYYYDFDDYMGDKDERKMFVTKLLAEGSGNCHSLPLLYKILAEELGLEAFLSYSPNHCFIKHRDERGRWHAIELTWPRYVNESVYWKSGGIKNEAVESKLYLDTVGTYRTAGECLVDLAQGWIDKIDYYDETGFGERCCNLALVHDRNNWRALLNIGIIWERQLRVIREKAGNPPESDWGKHPALAQRAAKLRDVYRLLDAAGFIPMTREQYEKWLKSLV